MKELKKCMYLVLVAMATLTISCTKEGPAGPPGSDGTNGIDGTNGTDGADGNSTCMECHNNDMDLQLKINQFKHSVHFTGGAEHVGYGARESCSMCHSHQGFKTAVAADNNNGGAHAEATPMSCYTCHKIHETYTAEDYDLHYKSEVDLYLNENDVFTDLMVDATNQYSDPNGLSNTCIKCHQPRHRGDDQPDPTMDGTLTITSSHFGPHYGAQGAIFGGVGGYIGTTDPTAPSETMGHHSCKSCHMSFVASTGNYGEYIGGHAMGLRATDEDDVEFGACNTCHSDRGATIDLEGIMASTKALHDLLGQDLMDAGIIDEEGHIIPGDYTHQQLAAFWNYSLVKNDHSYGIHNQEYSEDLITAGRAYLGTNN